jgi:UDP-N-acetylmuramoylalanine--D-glutamate ligase
MPPAFGLPHRMEEVARIGEALFINDSKATNADSTQRALESFPRMRWILGGKPKAGGIASLERYFPKIAKAYLIGAAAEEFAATLEGRVPYEHCGTLDAAVARAAADAREAGGGVVLFSPACASFDQFRSFEHRGDVFREIVRGMIEE